MPYSILLLPRQIKIWIASILLTALSLAAEPGSGYYVKDCKHPGGGYNITINKDGTAMVETDPDVYENLLTSCTFFGNTAPPSFLVAILFDAKNSPMPLHKGESWIEIWKTAKSDSVGYYALINGRTNNKLQKCK